MCGICGLIDLTNANRANPHLVYAMTQQIKHRGPDGDGFYHAPSVSLGMRRLSIIDVEGSNQPLYNEDQTLALVLNGEIYNYRELRQHLQEKGHQLRTEGDGETILHLYEEYGLDLFQHLRGMYAFALWDTARQRLVLAVDHIGMKPLYLHERDGMLAFASEVKAFFADPAMPRGMNLATLDAYLSFGYMIGAETLFEGVRRLPPGHMLIAEGGQTRLQCHWAFGENATTLTDPSESGVIDLARERIRESVKLHLRSDVPLGLFLSGGIDSAALLGLMAQEAAGRIKTFTIGYETETPDNELIHARRIAEHFQTEHHERVINASEWWDGFQDYVYFHDEPNANPSAISLMLLSELTAQQVRVVLTGLGGDELFGGYPHHHMIPALLRNNAQWGQIFGPMAGLAGALEPYYPQMKRFRVIGALPHYLPRIRQTLLPPQEGILRMQSFDGVVFSDALRDQLYGPALKAAVTEEQYRQRAYAEIFAQSQRDDPYNTAQALVIHTWLTANALLSQDKTGMAHGLEARVPFFDPLLMDFAASVPPEVRMKQNKYVLREAMRPYLPDFALQRPKQPFGTPILNWFKHDLQSQIQAVLYDSSVFDANVFDRPALDRVLKAHFSGRESHTELILRLLTLALWQGRFLAVQGQS